MKIKLLFSFLSLLGFSLLQSKAQSTYGSIYELFQTNCTFCHNNTQVKGGLDLEGTGSTFEDKMHDVYTKLAGKMPANTFAASRGYRLVDAGDPYRSFLFRKINRGLARDITLHPLEGGHMPEYGGIPLRNEEKELIRQWILYGAPETGKVVDTSLIYDFYNGKGITSAKTPPPPPDSTKGFQIHLGPFFLPPTTVQKRSEAEFYLKYRTDLKDTLEVIKVEPYMGQGYSHHFILYRFKENEMHINAKDGLRTDNAHFYEALVSAHQGSQAVELPQRTAFVWPQETYLDLNTHYINYDKNNVLACEVYLNIYTQPKHTAKQEMLILLVPNTSIYIPNDGKKYTFTEAVFDSVNDYQVYMWNLASHTHQYGTGYQIYKRNIDGSRGEQLYEGSCPGGVPGCGLTYYDYQHPPVRYFEPFLPLRSKEGLIHEGSYVNTGDVPVQWGQKSSDEMMVMAFMYTLDTAGLGGTTTGITEAGAHNTDALLSVYPNPFSKITIFRFKDKLPPGAALKIYDITGKELRNETNLQSKTATPGIYQLDASGLPSGIYFYQLTGYKDKALNGKLIVE